MVFTLVSITNAQLKHERWISGREADTMLNDYSFDGNNVQQKISFSLLVCASNDTTQRENVSIIYQNRHSKMNRGSRRRKDNDWEENKQEPNIPPIFLYPMEKKWAFIIHFLSVFSLFVRLRGFNKEWESDYNFSICGSVRGNFFCFYIVIQVPLIYLWGYSFATNDMKRHFNFPWKVLKELR